MGSLARIGREVSGRRRIAGGLCSGLSGVLLLTGCVSPATTTTAYEAKAALTAQDATSAMRTALLAVHTFDAGDLQAGYLEVVLVESEEALGAVQSAFESVQPPDTESADRLREELGTLLDDGVSGLAETRIAARRDEPAALSRMAGALGATADDLDSFASGHVS